MRNVENPHLKDDEFDLIDMIKIEGTISNMNNNYYLITLMVII